VYLLPVSLYAFSGEAQCVASPSVRTGHVSEQSLVGSHLFIGCYPLPCRLFIKSLTHYILFLHSHLFSPLVRHCDTVGIYSVDVGEEAS